jgi:hypothetical protein
MGRFSLSCHQLVVGSGFSQSTTCAITNSKSFKEVVDSTECRLWKDNMVKEMGSLHKNEMWDFIELLSGRNPFDSKWAFKKKLNVTCQVEKFKARLVVKGYSQVNGVDFGEIFSHVSKLNSILVLIYFATTFDLRVEKMHVKTMFLHGYLEE